MQGDVRAIAIVAKYSCIGARGFTKQEHLIGTWIAHNALFGIASGATATARNARGKVLARHVPRLSINRNTVPTVAAKGNVNRRPWDKACEDVTAKGGRVSQIETTTCVCAHIHRATSGRVGQILGHDIPFLAIDGYLRPFVSLFHNIHPSARWILTQHRGFQGCFLTKIERTALYHQVAFSQ